MVGKGGAKVGERRSAARRLADRAPGAPQTTLNAGSAALAGWNTTIDDRLAQTYFHTRPAAPVTTVPRRRSPLLVASVSLFTCVVGLWVAVGPAHWLATSFGRGHPVAPVEVTETFDQPTVAPKVGVWLGAPDDVTQGCRLSYTALHRVGKTGYGLIVDYDVDSPHPATAGVWIAIPTGQAVAGGAFSFFIRGDPIVGYSQTCVVELQSDSGRSRYDLDGITNTWQQVIIPFQRFMPVPDVASVHHLLFLFEDWHVTRKRGRVYVDEVRLGGGNVSRTP